MGKQSQVPPDFTQFFNTRLSPSDERDFQGWVNQEGKSRGRDLSGDLKDYDLRGFWQSQQGTSDNGHAPDTFKKPNHPTFSDQSQYHGVDGYLGGQWSENDGETSFTPSKTNIGMYGSDGLQSYFTQTEPDVNLNWDVGKW